MIPLVVAGLVACASLYWLNWAWLIAWFLGACVSMGLQSCVGAKNPTTIGDSFSGDDECDLTLAVLWFVFLPAWFFYVAGLKAAKFLVR